MKLTIAYIYPKELNLYGDTGNVEIIKRRAQLRNIEVEINEIDKNTKEIPEETNLIFMGGGPDTSQKTIYEDLTANKGPFIKEYINNEGVALFICGSYQLMGHFYKTADGTEVKGLGIYDMYTQHLGNSVPRSVSNTVALLNDSITEDSIYKNSNMLQNYIVGFENHGGQTFLGDDLNPLAKIIVGNGNNAKDATEGVHYKNSIGTYFHGPFLSKNAHIADYLIAKALKIEKLKPLDDKIVTKAYTALLQRFNVN